MDYQVAVIGGGPGGYEAAIRCAKRKLTTVLIEMDELGGTCLNRGCIPTKALMHCAGVYESAKTASAFGVTAENVQYDYKAICKQKDGVVQRLRGGVASLEKAHGVTVVKGMATLIDSHTIEVNGAHITAAHMILATGSTPALPPIPGIAGKHVYTSDHILQMDTLPDSFVIIGGGVIGIEFATLFSTLGKPVTLIEMLPEILAGVDTEIVALLKRTLAKKGVQLHTNARVTAIEDGEAVCVTYETNGAAAQIEAGCCIVSIGRKPNTDGLGLEAAGIRTERGHICVNEQMQTNVPHIYAVGDVTGKVLLAHVASAQGIAAADHIGGLDVCMRYDVVPSCIYTSPEIAYVGCTEAAARAAGRNVLVGRYNLAGNGKSMLMQERTGLVKLVADADSGEVLGAQLFGPHATDMIAQLCTLMRCEGTIEELADTIHPHPTVSESILEAAHDVHNLSCHTMPR